jgi:hypothetical protein
MLEQHKLTKLELIWVAVIFWAVAFTAIEAPFSFVFKTKIQTWQLWADALLSVIFIADLVYRFKETVKEKQNKKTKSQSLRKDIFILIDVIACIPFDIITFVFNLSSGLHVITLLRLFRLLRIGKVFNLLGNLTIIPKWVKVQMYLTSSLVIIHWITCIWIWLHPILKYGNGLVQNDYYIRSLYWAVTTLTTIGYGDITPQTNAARLFCMVIMILGVGVYGIVIGNVANMIQNANRYKEQNREKIHELSSFLKYYKIPDRLQSACYDYYNHIFSQRLSDNDSKIISDLPHALQQELQTYMNMKLISKVPVFKNCGIACLKAVASVLEQKFYAPGHTIINTGEIGDEMFIIGHGKVDIILQDGGVIATLHQGQFFGEQALLEHTTRNANVRAHEYCDLYKLHKNDFLKIIQIHPELADSIAKVINRRASDKNQDKKIIDKINHLNQS